MSVSLNGVNQALALRTAFPFPVGVSAVTFCCWMQHQSAAPLANNAQIVSVEINGGGGNTRFEVQLQGSSKKVQFFARAPDAGAAQTGLSVAVWPTKTLVFPSDHLAICIDVANDAAAIYINGALDSSFALAFTNAAFDATLPAQDNYIGVNSFSGTQWFDGDISDARLYSRCLNADEIRTIYECNGHDGYATDPAIVYRWRIDESHRNTPIPFDTVSTDVRDVTTSAYDIGSVDNPGLPSTRPEWSDHGQEFRRRVP